MCASATALYNGGKTWDDDEYTISNETQDSISQRLETRAEQGR